MNLSDSMGTLIEQYVDARQVVIENGFDGEIDWQFGKDLTLLDESEFLREGAWVILSSGMRESVIRGKFDDISEAFCGFSSAIDIVQRSKKCRDKGLSIFNNEKKIDAILSMSARVALDGFSRVKQSVEVYGVVYLQAFDFIGPTTSFHFAKNLGINVSKPDRHLCRVARVAGFDTVQQLCEEISDVTGDPVSVVDLVIWRFATLRPDYQVWFSQAAIN